jgi:acetyl-CoA C-acetyltransferase
MEIFVCSPVRTAVGAFCGSLSSIQAHMLGSALISHIIQTQALDPLEISEVIMGQVLVGGMGQNPARQSAIKAGLDKATPAWMVSQVCGSGMRAIALAASTIKSGDANMIIAGGQENMSLAQHSIHMRKPIKMGHGALQDMMITDGLWDAFNDYHMGNTAENLAKLYSINRDEADLFAYTSQMRASKAQQSGKFTQEIVPIKILVGKDEVLFRDDEYIRHDSSIEGLAKLKPAFDKSGIVTAGNASGINDGGAAMIIANATYVQKCNLQPIARIVSTSHCGVEPSIMGIGPASATKIALSKAGWKIEDLDLVESNEAFAVQAIAVQKELGLDPNIVNVNGGSIAIGHPIGASGARIITTLLHEMKRRNSKKGLATMCVGGGMGVATCFELC